MAHAQLEKLFAEGLPALEFFVGARVDDFDAVQLQAVFFDEPFDD